MGFEVKEKKGLVLLVMQRLDKRMAMKESAWRQLSLVSAKINDFEIYPIQRHMNHCNK